jgi:hypothetical protein
MGIAELDKQNHELCITASLFFYGDAASEALSRAVAADIQNHWNEPQAMVTIKSVLYNIVFRINGIYAPGLQSKDVYENDNPAFNYFRIEEFCTQDISFVDGIGSNTGYFKLANLLNNSTTAAHEFGHTLGLEHPDVLDIRGETAPGIMYPRGTITDPHFQYDPAAAPAAKGGTLNPVHRKVLQKDIDLLRLNRLNFSRHNQAVIGGFSSVWHDKHE